MRTGILYEDLWSKLTWPQKICWSNKMQQDRIGYRSSGSSKTEQLHILLQQRNTDTVVVCLPVGSSQSLYRFSNCLSRSGVCAPIGRDRSRNVGALYKFSSCINKNMHAIHMQTHSPSCYC